MRDTRRVSPLAIVLPRPAIHNRRSSVLSTSSSSPRTPRSSGSPCSSLYFTSSNRLSSDSWNSSVEELESDWKPDQVVLLQRTLNALPVHLVTPYNGPIPPSNLLDKIARGVADKKGPVEWPHSLRATRVKLIEICRTRAAEEDRIFTDENEDPDDMTPKKAIRRPYRQSSMEFINSSAPSAKDNPNISRLSARLQRTDRVITDPSHRKAQPLHRRSSSPPRPTDIPPLLNPSTPSSSTLSTLSSADRPRLLRRSASSLTTSDSFMSSSSTDLTRESDPAFALLPSSMPVASDPRIQRVRRSESFCGTSAQEGPSFLASSATPGPNRLGFKRAPSFGTIAQEAKARGQHYTYGSSAEDLSFTFEPSSDEEEKLRNKLAKKPRTKSGTVAVSTQKPPSTKSGPTTRSKSAVSADTKTSTPSSTKVAETPVRRPVRRMPLQRQPHMFQPELPHLHIPSSGSQEQILATPMASPTASSRPLPDPPAVVPAGQVRTLRRVRRLRPSRRISFGSLAPPASGDDADGDGEGEEFELGSAFQLH